MSAAERSTAEQLAIAAAWRARRDSKAVAHLGCKPAAMSAEQQPTSGLIPMTASEELSVRLDAQSTLSGLLCAVGVRHGRDVHEGIAEFAASTDLIWLCETAEFEPHNTRRGFIAALQHAEREGLIIEPGEGGRPRWVNPYQLALVFGSDHE